MRRSDERTYESGEAVRGLMIALKKLWVRDWNFEATLMRLERTGSIGLEARSVLVFAGTPHPDTALSRQVSQELQEQLQATSVEGMVAGLYQATEYQTTPST